MSLFGLFLRSALAGALGVGLARPALADVCTVAVVADSKVLERYPELPSDVENSFAARQGIDSCAKVNLGVSRVGISVGVTLADGRSASRFVTEREDVVPVLEALLVLPHEDRADAVPASTASPPVRNEPSPPKAPLRLKLGVSERAELDRSTANPDDRGGPGVELSVATSGRVGDGHYSVGLGALSFVQLRSWLVGFEGRADSYTVANGEPLATLELALLAGRRLRFQQVSLDFIAGPAIAIQGGAATVETGPAREGTENSTTSGIVPRVLLASHLNFPARSVVRGFLGVEGEVGPSGRSDGDAPFGPPPLPVWMVGLALGVTVGTR